MIHLLQAHPGHHIDPDTLSAALLFFRRALRMPWRKPTAPAERHAAGAATPSALLGEPRQHDGLSDAEIAALKPSPMRPSHYERSDGDIVVTTQNEVVIVPSHPYAQPPWPPAEKPVWAEPEPRGPVRDTRMDVAAPHYAPDTAPEYQRKPVAEVLEAERLTEAMLP